MPGDGGAVGPGSDARARRAPYIGLRAFGDSDEDAELFAGRDDDSELVMANLRASRLTILYGPSGVGKSSLLHARVVQRVAKLAREARRAGAPAPTILLHDDWAGDADAALARIIDAAQPAGVSEPRFDGRLETALKRWANARAGMLLIVLDQFEEYLRLHPEGNADGFDDAFPEVATRPDLPVHFLIALRDDALAELDRFEGRIPHLFDNYLRLPPITVDAARRAIELPVTVVSGWREQAGLDGVELEEGLADVVLTELSNVGVRSPRAAEHAAPGPSAVIEPAYLQLVMRRLWDVDVGRGSATLRRATLDELGGAIAIARGHLDAAMDTLTPRQQQTASALFGYLVTPSGAKIRHTAADLAAYSECPRDEVVDVLRALSTPELRIIQVIPSPSGETDRDGYEIFHDVLAEAARDWHFRHRVARLERRTTRLLVVLAAVAAMVVALIAYVVQPGPLRRLDLRTVDARFGLRGDRAPDPRIVVAAIDDRTLAAVGRRASGLATPIVPRADQARVIDALSAARPAAIVEDVEYLDNVGDPAGTTALERAARRARARLVLAATQIDDRGNTFLFGAKKPVTALGLVAGYSGLPGDPGAVLRRMPFDGRLSKSAQGGLPALAVRAAELVGTDVRPASFPSRGAWIDYHGGSGSYPRVSLIDVLSGRAPPSRFRGKIVIVGATSKQIGDVHPTSAAGGTVLAGPEIQANAIDTILHGLPLRDVAPIVVALIIVALALAPAALAMRLSLALTLAVSAVLAVLLLVAAQLAFNAGRVLPVVYPLLALVLSAAAVALVEKLRGDVRRQRATSTTSTFVASKVTKPSALVIASSGSS